MTRLRLFALTLAGLATACGSAAPVQPPVMELSATAADFAAATGGSDPAAQVITVGNSGGGTMTTPGVRVSYSGTAGWLQATLAGAAAPYALTLRASLGALAAGTHRATVTLASASAANSPRTVDVTFTVTAGPGALSLTASAVEFRAASPGAAAAPQVVTASSTNPAALPRPTAAVTYPPGGPAGWLTATVSAAPGPYQVTLEADSTGLPLGLATAAVEVAAAGVAGSPRTIAVRLWVGRVVEVRRLLTRWAEDGSSAEAADAAVEGAALLQDDGAGGLARVAAVPGLAAGSWLAPAAAGVYWAELTFSDGARLLAQADADLLDLGEDLGGRAGRVRAAQPTDVTLTLDGLIGWQALQDVLRLASWGAQAAAELAPTEDPSATPFTFDWAATMATLLVPADTLWVGHYSRALPEGGGVSGTFEYLEAQAATSQAGLALVDGAAADVSPPAATGATPANVAVDWRLDAMEAAAAPFDPLAVGYAHRLGLYAIPAPLDAPSPLGAVAATVLEATQLPGSGDLVEPSVSIGRFLPAAWREYQEAAFAAPVNRRAPGATTPLAGAAEVVLAREAAAATLLARPLVAAPVAPTVDGLDATAPGNLVTLAPAIAWGAPTAVGVGAPTSYQVELVELTAAGAATAGRTVATFVLGGTTLAVPPGLLSPGRAYAAVITARSRPTDAGGATPLRTGVPAGSASRWTEVFTTAP